MRRDLYAHRIRKSSIGLLQYARHNTGRASRIGQLSACERSQKMSQASGQLLDSHWLSACVPSALVFISIEWHRECRNPREDRARAVVGEPAHLRSALTPVAEGCPRYGDGVAVLRRRMATAPPFCNGRKLHHTRSSPQRCVQDWRADPCAIARRLDGGPQVIDNFLMLSSRQFRESIRLPAKVFVRAGAARGRAGCLISGLG